MRRDEMADLTVFVAVAEEKSFTRAAARLGMSQSALSQIVRKLEARLDLRLLTRTTRSVAPTEIGERLLTTLRPMLKDLDAVIESLSEFRDEPKGTIRINSVEHAARTVLIPALADFLKANPGVHVEIFNDYALSDIVSDRFDAGVRLGDQVAKDMIAVRISPEIPMAIVGSPEYFSECRPPVTPGDLTNHRCINLRLPTSGGLYEWPLAQDGKRMRVRVEGPLIANTIEHIREAVLSGLGLAFLPLDQVKDDIRAGRLKSALENWTEPLPPYHLYYPNRRHSSLAFRMLVDVLRHRSD